MLRSAQWRTLVQNMRERFPIEGRVVVIRCPCKKWDGSCRTKGNGDFTIRVSSSREWSGQVDALHHEWAHMLAIEAAYKHHKAWGKLYAKIYRVWAKELDGKEKASTD